MSVSTLYIAPDGTSRAIAGTAAAEVLDAVGPTRTVRASRIVPEGRGLRLAFLALRCAFGDRGRVAAWTRTWRGKWQVLIPTPSLFPPGFAYVWIGGRDSHAAAVAFEVDWLEATQLRPAGRATRGHLVVHGVPRYPFVRHPR